MNSPSFPKAVCLNVHVHNTGVQGNDFKDNRKVVFYQF